MFSTEIKETVAIAVGAMLLAALLGFIVYALQLGYNMSATHNEEVHTKESLASFREYNKYDSKTELVHTDVVSAIRDYYTTDTTVVVKESGKSPKLYTKASAILDKDSITTERLHNEYIKNGAPGNGVYESYLVYGSPDINYVLTRIEDCRANSTACSGLGKVLKPASYDTGVTGIIFYKN